jgi:hypothetical protein
MNGEISNANIINLMFLDFNGCDNSPTCVTLMTQ